MRVDKTAIITSIITGIFGLISSTLTVLLTFYLNKPTAGTSEAHRPPEPLEAPGVEELSMSDGRDRILEVPDQYDGVDLAEPWLIPSFTRLQLDPIAEVFLLPPWIAALTIIGVTLVTAVIAYVLVHGYKVLRSSKRKKY